MSRIPWTSGTAHVPLIIFLLERLHVLSDVTTEDVLLQDLRIELLGLRVVTREALLVVGDEDTAVRRTLEGTEHTGTGRRALETDVKVALEWTRLVLAIKLLSEGEGTVGLSNTLVLVRKTELGQRTTSAKEASRVRYMIP